MLKHELYGAFKVDFYMESLYYSNTLIVKN